MLQRSVPLAGAAAAFTAIVLLRLRRRRLEDQNKETPAATSDLVLPPASVEELRREFEADGVVIVKGVISPAEVRWLRATLVDVMATGDVGGRIDASTEAAGGRFLMELDAGRWHAGLREFALRSSVPALAAQVLGCHAVRFFMDHVFLKEAGERSAHLQCTHGPL